MTKLNSIIIEHTKKLRGAKSLDEIRKAVEKDLYKKFGVSRRVEAMAYEIADSVAENLKVK